jgi:hypothetical protein
VAEPDIEFELARAREARAAGHEGRVRVGARRAAGRAIRAYYRRRDGLRWSGDALTQLKRLQTDEAVPGSVRQAAARLTTVVDLDHHLPFAQDPLEDARTIIDGLA